MIYRKPALLTFVMLSIAAMAISAQVPKALPRASDSQSRVSDSVNSIDAQTQTSPVEGPSKLRVFAGKSLVINSADPLKRISITDPAIAEAITISPHQVLIHGIAPGNVTLLLWDEQERLRSFDLQVELDISTLREAIDKVFPEEKIQVSQAGTSVVLTGTVSSKEIAERAVALAQTETKNVVNILSTVEESNQVLLQVRFAEVDRSAIQQFGINLFSTGAGNTVGSTSTQQFGQTATNSGAVPSNVERGRDPQAPSLVTGAIGNRLEDSPSVFGLSDLLNIFIFRPDLNLGLTVRALQQRNLLQILAEPNLLALNGREASFLAGGEFPFPIVQQGGAFNTVTIVFKEFGVRLKFTPTLSGDGTIRLKVAPEVSSLDFSNALTISGFLIPAISSRRAETEVELRDGQSFAIAGLIDNRLTEIASKVPVLGDIPIIGKFFRSHSTNRANTELMVLVTPRLVKPLSPGQVPPLPTFPKHFLDKEKFDGKTGETPPPTQPNRP